MQTNNPCELLTATMPVGSGGLLGCWLLWLVRLICVVLLVMEIKLLTMLYKDKREYEQANRKDNEHPSEKDDVSGQPLQSPARNVCKLRSQINHLCVKLKNRRRGEWAATVSNHGSRNVFVRLFDLCTNICGCHKTKTRKQPNVP